MILRPGSALAATFALSSPCHRPFLLRAAPLFLHPAQRFASHLPPQKQNLVKKPAPTPPVQRNVDPEELVNPPVSTSPIPLDLPEREPGQNYFSHLLRTGKQYLAFYKAGVKNVNVNRGLAAKLGHARAFPQRPDQCTLSRAEFQLIRRSRYDMRRVPVFAVLLLLLGEWLPLVVVFVSGLVPRTCRIPKQISKDLYKRELLRRNVPVFSDPAYAREQPRNWLVLRNRAHGLLPAWLLQTAAPLCPTYLLWFRLRAHLRYLAVDDYLLKRDGGEKLLIARELRTACDERGINTGSKDKLTMQRALGTWLSASPEKKGYDMFGLDEKDDK
ncbi:uncharacterized protein K452DRAFT_285143 [Aplosporella prunicola CBS 121167]|uniref:Letm1 RBD domain-containing protein n=1 Tax=Aplosporella prunicola CBS 121167 TaxID=1176127 RepID=A0A6A6BN27_9PEZI|nr:uncharacterized protein K452DRAFT_285143 [Aplosporella prunicola CBS 121167]KAF2144813.1 hypothetical protein K452DRAFT_285143 [Aplosporella prunicola CBS 121167]